MSRSFIHKNDIKWHNKYYNLLYAADDWVLSTEFLDSGRKTGRNIEMMTL